MNPHFTPRDPPSMPSASQSVMVILLAAGLALAILTLWISAYWPTAAFEILVFALAAAALARGTPVPSWAAWPLALIAFVVLWGGIQLLAGWSAVHSDTVTAIWKWVTWLVVFWLGASLLADPVLSHKVRVGMVWFGFALAVEAILQAFLSPHMIYGLWPAANYPFVMGPILYHTHFAVLIELLLPMALCLAFSDRRRTATYTGIAAVLLASVVVSASRGGLVLVVLETVVVLVLLHRRGAIPATRTRMVILSLVGAAAILMLIVGVGTPLERFRSDALLPSRLPFVISTLHMIAARPWTGFGLGCWPSVYPEYASFDAGTYVNQAHCDWLQWLAEGGILAGLATLSLAFWAFKPAVRSVWGLGSLAVFAHAAFDYPFSRPAMGAWVFLILAMAASFQPAWDSPSSRTPMTQPAAASEPRRSLLNDADR